jgi:hypothetical protein
MHDVDARRASVDRVLLGLASRVVLEEAAAARPAATVAAAARAEPWR